MPAYIFQTILEKGARAGVTPGLSKKSIDWFRNQAKHTTVDTRTLLKTHREKMKTNPVPGQMYLFAYDPKTKDKLPYWDKYPLVIPFSPTEDGFIGLNLHYLPLPLRARLMDGLYEHLNNTKLDETTQIKISYKLLNRIAKLRYFQPCVKRYLFSHARSNFLHISPTEWDTALFLPAQQFVGASKQKVWKDSRRTIHG